MRVLLVVDPTRDHAAFLRDVATAATDGLRRGGNDVDEIDLVATQFPPVMTSADRRAYFTAEPLVCPEVERSADLVRRADALVFVYPTTLSTVTAGLKGWIERTFVPGVAFTIGDTMGTERGLSNIRRLVGISVYDESHREVLRHGDNGRRLIRRNIRLCGGLGTSSRWLALYDCGRVDEQRRATFLGTVERKLARL